MNTNQMKISADSACAQLKVLAHPDRLMIICHLAEGELSVGDLADVLELRASTVSQHLSLLRREGILKNRREGQTVRYSIGTPSVQLLVDTLYKMHCKGAVPGKKREEQ